MSSIEYEIDGVKWTARAVYVGKPFDPLSDYSLPRSTLYWSEAGRHFRLPREGEEDCP